VDGLDEYASSVLKESNNVFTESVSFPIRQRVESKSDLEGFVKKQKAAMAADLEILTGSSDNPAICIGAIASVKLSALENNDFKKEDYGKFLITSIEHHVTDNGKYYNSFEAIPSGLEVIPVKNIILPIAETQIATVKDNKDPDNMGRVRVQMLWQQSNDEMTDWLRVMTPDAGSGKDSAKNRGLVVVPEAGDQVLVCFRYNDPDRPFVLGSMFHGKTGGGGGDSNKTKSLTALSGSKVSMDGKAVTIVDADEKSKVFFDGTGKIEVTSSESITFTCGDSSVSLKKDGTIEIKGKKSVLIAGDSESVKVTSDTLVKLDSKATVEIQGTQSTSIKSDAKVEVSSPSTSVEGKANLKLQSTGIVDVEGTAMTNVKGGIVNLN
jgi:uncharacterized protein involved in type VI secretion and phage assembly